MENIGASQETRSAAAAGAVEAGATGAAGVAVIGAPRGCCGGRRKLLRTPLPPPQMPLPLISPLAVARASYRFRRRCWYPPAGSSRLVIIAVVIVVV